MKNKTALVPIILIILIIGAFLSFQTQNININIIEGQSASISIGSPFGRLFFKNNSSDLSINGSFESYTAVDTEKKIIFYAEKKGKYELRANILKGIPYRQVTVNVLDDEPVYVGGDIVGIDLNTRGVIAVGFEDIKTGQGILNSPAKEAGIRIGDVISSVEGVEIDSAEEFSQALSQLMGSSCRITLWREEVKLNFEVGVATNSEGKPQIGLWVRERVMGLGTLSFVTADREFYGALGHAVTDSTSGVVIPIKQGALVGADVISLVKGKADAPGEIRGVLSDRFGTLGSVLLNNEYGICGRVENDIMFEQKKMYPIALQKEVREGTATIFCTIDDSGIQEYEIFIEQVYAQSEPGSKSMRIRITDEILLEKTGGIIQGMSGSPIVQNGKIVGAITHVLVNDSTRGYGIFIEWMINNVNDCH